MDKKIKAVLAAGLLLLAMLSAQPGRAQGFDSSSLSRVDLKTDLLGGLGISRQPQATSAKEAFRRLTNIAGMLSGRVDVASVGSWRVKLVFDLR